MGRPSKLSDKQWEEIGRRILDGEKPSALAREFKVSPATISQRFSKSVKNVKTVADQIVKTQAALASLTISEQVQAVSLADALRSISTHMAGAANYSAATTHRLAGMANMKVLEVDDAAPLTDKGKETLKDVAVLQRLANECSSIPLNLLAANRESVKLVNQDTPVTPVAVTVQVEDASIPEPATQ